MEGRNGYAGKPPVTSVGQCYYTLTVSVTGNPDPESGYLLNIRQIDEAVRDRAIPLITAAVRAGCQGDEETPR